MLKLCGEPCVQAAGNQEVRHNTPQITSAQHRPVVNAENVSLGSITKFASNTFLFRFVRERGGTGAGFVWARAQPCSFCFCQEAVRARPYYQLSPITPPTSWRSLRKLHRPFVGDEYDSGRAE